MLQRLPANRVAILLSTFNGARFLPAQLESLLGQTFEEWTLYWRDDGSTDNSVAVVEAFARAAGQGRCVQVQCTTTRLRPAASYLALLAAVQHLLAEQDMVAFADQDDVWLPEKLARGVAALRPLDKLAAELNCGVPTLKDILEQLVRPGRDPRQDLQAPLLRSDVLSMEDLQPGMRLKGTVRNVIDFGAFVDLGVKHDGLLHVSQMPRGTLLKVGDILDVEILKVESERGRIALGLVKK